MAKRAKKGKRGMRYSKAKQAAILAAAKQGGLTGEQVEKKFGISKLTFYRWRGPVRSDAVARRGKRGPGRPKGSKSGVVAGTGIGNGLLREQVRSEVRRVLPQVIRQEVEAYLKKILG